MATRRTPHDPRHVGGQVVGGSAPTYEVTTGGPGAALEYLARQVDALEARLRRMEDEESHRTVEQREALELVVKILDDPNLWVDDERPDELAQAIRLLGLDEERPEPPGEPDLHFDADTD